MNDSTSIAQIAQQTKAREAALPLMPQTSGSRFLLQPSPSAKVCLFFHGFTALPEQFVPIGEVFFQAGYNVLIPLLPGHGIAGNWDRNNPPPLPQDQQTYLQFGLYWLQQAQALGQQVIVGGLSGSGTLAVWLAQEHPQQIYRTLLFAPYLRNNFKVLDLLVRILDIYFEWKTEPGRVSFGYDGFLMPALEAFLNMGQDVLERAETRMAAPMFIISSESDRTVSEEDYQTLFTLTLQQQPKCWYHRFQKFFQIPHNMMTTAEGNDYQDLVMAIAKAYVESDLTWAEVEEIGYRMLKEGKTYEAVVAELHLTRRVAADLPTLMTIIDKEAIISSRDQQE